MIYLRLRSVYLLYNKVFRNKCSIDKIGRFKIHIYTQSNRRNLFVKFMDDTDVMMNKL